MVRWYLDKSTGSTVAFLLEGVVAWEQSNLAVEGSPLESLNPLSVLFFVGEREFDGDDILLVFGFGEGGILEAGVINFGVGRTILFELSGLFRWRRTHMNNIYNV